jgi:glycosyltransferase involved in cell wall biosynthesis
MPRIDLKSHNIAAVVPAYRVEGQFRTSCALPAYLKHVIVVDDASPDRTAALVEAVAKRDRRVILLRHERNQGVGGAMVTGFRTARELGAEIIAKVDGDGQMDIEYLPVCLRRWLGERQTTPRETASATSPL